jgi:hypothetical protein
MVGLVLWFCVVLCYPSDCLIRLTGDQVGALHAMWIVIGMLLYPAVLLLGINYGRRLLGWIHSRNNSDNNCDINEKTNNKNNEKIFNFPIDRSNSRESMVEMRQSSSKVSSDSTMEMRRSLKFSNGDDVEV